MSRYAKMILLVGAAVAGVVQCDEAVAGDDEWNAWLASGDAKTNAENELSTAGLNAGAYEFDAIVRNTQRSRSLQYATSYSYSYSQSAMPTPVPLPAPTPVPLPAPTALPLPAPTHVPLPAPSSMIPPSTTSYSYSYSYSYSPELFMPDAVVPFTIALSLGMTGMSCSEYGTPEEAVMNQALASLLDGVSDDDFSDHVCSDVTRRRGRALKGASDEIMIATDVTVDATEYADADVMGVVATTIAEAVTSGALASSVATYASAAGVDMTVVVTSSATATMSPTPSATTVVAVTTASPVASSTPSPVATSTPSPTPSPTSSSVLTAEDAAARQSTAAFGLGAAVCAAAAAFGLVW